MPRLVDCPGHVRLTAGCFALLILGFGLLAQVNLWVQDGGGSAPGPEQILWKYNGKPDSTKLHMVLDPALPEDDDHAMWPFLGATPAEIETRRKQIFDWIDAGAPNDDVFKSTLRPIFAGEETCGQCHAPDGTMASLPFEYYDEVLVVAQPDRGMPLGQLTISAHNHLFGFAVMALLLSLGLCMTRVGGRLRTVLILAAFVGPALDIGSWFLTKYVGAPFHLTVMAGGALFGLSTMAMALLILADALRLRSDGGNDDA